MKDTELIQKCPECKLNTQGWSEVYFDSKSKLIKVERTYISWCKKCKKYVLLNDKQISRGLLLKYEKN